MYNSKVMDYLKLIRLKNFGRVYIYQIFFVLFYVYFSNIGYKYLLVLFPYIFVSMGGYIHNNIVDYKTDNSLKNPITDGSISIKQAKKLMIFFIFLAVICQFFIFDYFLFISLCIYIFLWYGYNKGIGQFRLKESIFGPISASLILYCFYPLVFAIYLHKGFLIAVLIFIYGLSSEMGHTYAGYLEDKKNKINTFAVILGNKITFWMSTILLVTVYLLFLISFSYILKEWLFWICFVFLILINKLFFFKKLIKFYTYYQLFVALLICTLFVDVVNNKLYFISFLLILLYQVNTI